MARGRKPRVRCTGSESKTVSSFIRKLVGDAMLDHNYTQSRFHLRPTKARTLLKPPLKFHATPQNAVSQLNPLYCYKRRKSRLLQPDKTGPLTPPIQGSMDNANNSSNDSIVNSDNRNPSSVLENPGTNEGLPNSEALLASPNYNPNWASSNWFQKTPSIWEAVEKLKVFSQAPQRPHFMKLQR